jgi:glycosyltransferase involved in cell wall biosynthesis
MSRATGIIPGRRPRLLLYAMYDLRGPDHGPLVRVEAMARALGARCDLDIVSGSRRGRVGTGLHWLARRGFGSVDAVYVEASSSFATPFDLAFIGLARASNRPVGVYFRDAYQLFRNDYPLPHRRQHVLDWLWHLATPVLKRLASTRFAPSAGLVGVLGLESPVLLPPGTDPGLTFVGAGSSPLVAYVGALSSNLGKDLLVEALELVRREVPDARLRVITPVDPAARLARVPPWLEWVPTGRAGLVAALRDVRVCVIPFRITPYTNLAVPLKLFDYLSLGKPIVATATTEVVRILGPTDAGLLVADDPAALAAAIARVLVDGDLAAGLAARARALADDPAMSWAARAETVLATLLPGTAAAGGGPPA